MNRTSKKLPRYHYNKVFLVIMALIISAVLPSVVVAQAREDNTLRQVLRLADQDQWGAAAALAQKGGADVANLYEWVNLTRAEPTQDFDRYARFLAAHPHWPLTRRLRAYAEKVMPDDISPTRVMPLYVTNDPVSARGMIAYMRAAEETGQGETTTARLNEWFIEASLSIDEQNQIMRALAPQITRQTLMRRIDNLILDGHMRHATAMAAQMGQGVPELVAARLSLRDDRGGTDTALARVPKALTDDPGLVYERLRWRRQKYDAAAPVLDYFQSIPADFRPVNARAFFNEQQALTYRLLAEKNPQAAYRVAARPGLYGDDDRFARGQAMWLAGYIAQTYLNQPGRAFKHFEGLYQTALSPLTRARAAYWAGVSSARLGYADVARAWTRVAAAYPANYYGQLAAKNLPAGARVRAGGPPIATPDDQTVFRRSDLPRLAELLRGAGDTVRAELFINRIADQHDDRAGVVRLTVDLALKLKLTSVAVKISREAAMDGIDFADHVYPVLSDLGAGDVELALVHAIIRQESGFDTDAMSTVGARGLMQLMPATAAGLARQKRADHRHDWLTSRPDHNVRLGRAYLRQLIDQFGDYALVAAAYNAGPSRVREWIKTIGDPRSGEIEMVDFIERIPFYETRNYVQRVVEGVTVYRGVLLAPASTGRGAPARVTRG